MAIPAQTRLPLYKFFKNFLIQAILTLAYKHWFYVILKVRKRGESFIETDYD